MRFRDLMACDTNVCVLELSKEMTHDEVVALLGAQLGHDPAKIQLTQHSAAQHKPRLQPIKSSPKLRLTDMLLSSSYMGKVFSDILYFEKLDMTLAELESNKLFKIEWFDEKVTPVATHKVLVPKNALFSDVIAKLKEVIGPLHGTGEIRLLEVQNNHIYRLLKPVESTTGFTGQTALRAEEVPAEELNKDSKTSKTIQVAHGYRDGYPSTFGHPFYLVVPKSERFLDTKRRIQEKLCIPDDEFATWKFFIVPWLGKWVVVDNDTCIATKLDQTDYLALEHKPPRSRRRKEEQLVIKG